MADSQVGMGLTFSLCQKIPGGVTTSLIQNYQVGGVDYAVVGSFGPNKDGKNVYDSDDIYLILPVQ